MNVNFKSMVNVSQVICKGMVERRKGGAVVNVSSVGSKVASSERLAYGSSKAAMDQATRVMALELGPHKIRVNAVNPTLVWTDIARIHWTDPEKVARVKSRIPLGEIPEVDDVANAVLFLLSDKAAFINGTTLPVDGGRLSC